MTGLAASRAARPVTEARRGAAHVARPVTEARRGAAARRIQGQGREPAMAWAAPPQCTNMRRIKTCDCAISQASNSRGTVAHSVSCGLRSRQTCTPADPSPQLSIPCRSLLVSQGSTPADPLPRSARLSDSCSCDSCLLVAQASCRHSHSVLGCPHVPRHAGPASRRESAAGRGSQTADTLGGRGLQLSENAGGRGLQLSENAGGRGLQLGGATPSA